MSEVFFIVGILIVILTAASVLFTMVLPRRPTGIERVSLLANRIVRVAFGGLSALPERTRARMCYSPLPPRLP